MPLYPTALLARLAGDVSLISDGRLELGVGISWNPREYDALGQDVHVRGKRFEEQIILLRRLWTEPYVTFEGRWHRLDGIGLNQLLPPVPVYIGAGTDDYLLQRVARFGDGWIPLADPIEPLTRLRRFVEAEGKDPDAFVVSGRLMAGTGGAKEWVEHVRRLHHAGIRDMELFPARASPAQPPPRSSWRCERCWRGSSGSSRRTTGSPPRRGEGRFAVQRAGVVGRLLGRLGGVPVPIWALRDGSASLPGSVALDLCDGHTVQ